MIMIKTLCYEVTAMTTAQQQQAAKNFASYWKDKGYEKGESQQFWLSLLRDVYGIEHPEQFIQFEEQVHLDHTSLILTHSVWSATSPARYSVIVKLFDSAHFLLPCFSCMLVHVFSIFLLFRILFYIVHFVVQ